MKQGLIVFMVCGLLGLSWSVNAQVKTPAPSPSATFTQSVGLAEIKIEYSRPGVKGRIIYGDLVPYGELWRTGANGSTDVTFSDDVTVGNQVLAAGKYAIYTIPNEANWTIIFHKNSDYWGTGGDNYDSEGEVARFEVKPIMLTFPVETFTMGINNIKDASAEIMLLWEKTMVTFPFSFDTDKMVLASIEKTMSGPSANDYYNAARYYYDADKDLTQAHKWMSQATEMRDDAFWMFRYKSLIEAKMGEYSSAIKTAKVSMELAEKAGNKQYVKFNEEAIREWTSKM